MDDLCEKLKNLTLEQKNLTLEQKLVLSDIIIKLLNKGQCNDTIKIHIPKWLF